MKQRHQMLSQSKVYLEQNPSDARLTVEQLQEMVGTMNSMQLMNRLQRYAAKIQGSRQYWYARYQELKTLLEQKGSPTFFWTVSSADNYWPELHSLMPHASNDEVTHPMRVNAVINNPHITDWFFHAKLTDFVKCFLYDTLDVEWYWYRYEYQARGSTHAHGCAKLKNDPDLCKLVNIAAVGWIEEKANQDAIKQNSECYLNNHIVLYGLYAKEQAIMYTDWLVTTMNEAIPDHTWKLPQPHPCAQRALGIPSSALPEDYQSLVNAVQRHTRCNPAYCIKQKHNQQQPSCRFGYPKEVQTQTTLTFEQLPNGKVKATLTTKRNDPRVNSHNRMMLQNWRANVDIQVIIDVTACVHYMAKYVSKAEPKSKAVDAIFADCVGTLGFHSDSTSGFRKAMIKVVGERDFSAQETAHLLQSLPLYSCTYSFVTLCLDGGQEICTTPSVTKTHKDITIMPSMLDIYMQRQKYQNEFPSVMSLNMIEFVSTYTFHQNELKQRSNEVIVRTFPTHSPDPKGKKKPLYCKYQLHKTMAH